MLIRKAHASSQGINYGRAFADGSPHQTHLRIITSRVVPISMERQHGSFKVPFSLIGRQPGVRCFGFMENVRSCSTFLWKSPDNASICQLAQARAFSGLWILIYSFLGLLMLSIGSTVIREIEAMCEAGHASIAYFYFDFRDTHKQHWRDLVPSLLIQLSSRSGPRCDLLSYLYSTYDSGARQPSDDVLTNCLKDMLVLPDQHPIYLSWMPSTSVPTALGFHRLVNGFFSS